MAYKGCFCGASDSERLSEILKLDCGHAFHKTCVLQWVRQWKEERATNSLSYSINHASCPACKAGIVSSDADVLAALEPLQDLKARVRALAIPELSALRLLPSCVCITTHHSNDPAAAGRTAPTVAVRASAAALSPGSTLLLHRPRPRALAPAARDDNTGYRDDDLALSSSRNTMLADATQRKRDHSTVVPVASVNVLPACPRLSSGSCTVLAAALAKLSFYCCSHCGSAYFGGLRDCEQETAEADEVSAAGDSAAASSSSASVAVDRRCPGGCASRPVCSQHGNSSIRSKCLWCCSQAEYVCKGRNYYCTACHRIAAANVKRQLREGKRRNEVSPFDWRPLVQKDPHRRCKGDGHGGCALGLRHPPHGQPFFYCGACADSDRTTGGKKSAAGSQAGSDSVQPVDPVAELKSWVSAASAAGQVAGGAAAVEVTLLGHKEVLLRSPRIPSSSSSAAAARGGRGNIEVWPAVARASVRRQTKVINLADSSQELLEDDDSDIISDDGGLPVQPTGGLPLRSAAGDERVGGGGAPEPGKDMRSNIPGLQTSLRIDAGGYVLDVEVIRARAASLGRSAGRSCVGPSHSPSRSHSHSHSASEAEASALIDVVSVLPASASEAVANPTYFSAPHDVAVALLAALLARVACLRTPREQRRELVSRIARASAQSCLDRLLGSRPVEVLISGDDDDEAAADAVLRAVRASTRRPSISTRELPASAAASAAAADDAAADVRVSILHSILYAVEHVREHCYVCGTLHRSPGATPRTCGSDACATAELHTPGYMDLRSELAAKGGAITALLLTSALDVVNGDASKRASLLEDPPVAYRRHKARSGARAPTMADDSSGSTDGVDTPGAAAAAADAAADIGTKRRRREPLHQFSPVTPALATGGAAAAATSVKLPQRSDAWELRSPSPPPFGAANTTGRTRGARTSAVSGDPDDGDAARVHQLQPTIAGRIHPAVGLSPIRLRAPAAPTRNPIVLADAALTAPRKPHDVLLVDSVPLPGTRALARTQGPVPRSPDSSRTVPAPKLDPAVRRSSKHVHAARKASSVDASSASCRTSDAFALCPFETDWELLTADIRGLDSTLKILQLCDVPNDRAVRLKLRTLQAQWIATKGEAALSVGATSDKSVPLAQRRRSLPAQRTSASASSPVIAQLVPLAWYNWPEQTPAVTSATDAFADPDRWYKLLWWLLRTVRCDFTPVLKWDALPRKVRRDESLDAVMARQSGDSATSSARKRLGVDIHIFVLNTHYSGHPIAQSTAPLPLNSLRATTNNRLQAQAGTDSLVDGSSSGDADIRNPTRAHAVSSRPAPVPLKQPTSHSHGGEGAHTVGKPVRVPVDVYHGSGASRWHSILRSGLRSLSRTDYEAVGHKRGDGVYLAPAFKAAFKYAKAAAMAADEEGKEGTVTGVKRFRAVAVVHVDPTPGLLDFGDMLTCKDGGAMRLTHLVLLPARKHVAAAATTAASAAASSKALKGSSQLKPPRTPGSSPSRKPAENASDADFFRASASTSKATPPVKQAPRLSGVSAASIQQTQPQLLSIAAVSSVRKQQSQLQQQQLMGDVTETLFRRPHVGTEDRDADGDSFPAAHPSHTSAAAAAPDGASPDWRAAQGSLAQLIPLPSMTGKRRRPRGEREDSADERQLASETSANAAMFKWPPVTLCVRAQSASLSDVAPFPRHAAASHARLPRAAAADDSVLLDDDVTCLAVADPSGSRLLSSRTLASAGSTASLLRQQEGQAKSPQTSALEGPLLRLGRGRR